MGQIIGIDLGTTHSLCAAFTDGTPRLIPNALGRSLTPSAVAVLEDGQVVVGENALEIAVLDPRRAATRFKRVMGTDQTFDVGARPFSAPELSSIVLRALKRDAEIDLGHRVDEAVITVPAYFNELQREATRVAGEMAGLVVRRILNEPTAAALTYGLIDRQADKRLLVFDLGGGTFDVTLMEVFEGTLEIVATAGESHLGGEDFTDRISSWMLGEHGLALEQVEMFAPKRAARLRFLAEQAKRRLGSADSIDLILPHEDGTIDDRCPTSALTNPRFLELCQPLVDRLRTPLEKVLRDGRVDAREVDEVILAGGATRMPVARQLVMDLFGRDPLCSEDPDEVVARGAAVQAALILDDAAVEDVVMTDVCPFTLGIAITKDIQGQLRDGYYLPIIHRNTTIPVAKEEIVQTLNANQSQIRIRVFQGEARKVEGNTELGELEVRGIPPGPAGQSVAVRFTYDLNGLLEVEARIEATGEKHSTVFTHRAKNLSKDDVRRAVAAMQTLKFFPREDVRHQRLLLFAERVVGEVPSFHREQLEQAVDAFESALHGNDPGPFESARARLLEILSALDHPFDDDEAGG